MHLTHRFAEPTPRWPAPPPRTPSMPPLQAHELPHPTGKYCGRQNLGIHVNMTQIRQETAKLWPKHCLDNILRLSGRVRQPPAHTAATQEHQQYHEKCTGFRLRIFSEICLPRSTNVFCKGHQPFLLLMVLLRAGLLPYQPLPTSLVGA